MWSTCNFNNVSEISLKHKRLARSLLVECLIIKYLKFSVDRVMEDPFLKTKKKRKNKKSPTLPVCSIHDTNFHYFPLGDGNGLLAMCVPCIFNVLHASRGIFLLITCVWTISVKTIHTYYIGRLYTIYIIGNYYKISQSLLNRSLELKCSYVRCQEQILSDSRCYDVNEQYILLFIYLR